MPDAPDEGHTPIAVYAVAVRVVVLSALLASSALYAQYLDPVGASFCSLHSGCEAVRRSALGYFGSRFISLPLVGLVAYSAVYGVSVFRVGRWLLVVLTSLGAVAAIGLVLTQALYVKAFCWLCLVVDGAAVLAAAGAALEWRARATPALDPLKRAGWVAYGVLAIFMPLIWVQLKPAPPVPDVIRALYQPGKINVVEFADFECPFCRAYHPVLRSVLESYAPDKLHFVRKQVPLPMHELAVPAARADICAEDQGKGEELADRLMTIELEPSAIRRAAVSVGVDPVRFDQCVASPEPDRRIAEDTKTLKEAEMEGLPTTYVGGKRLLGLVPEEALRDALDRAERGESDSGVPGPLYLAICAAIAGAIAWFGRARRATLQHGSNA